jgi:enamine deaminase RidA (YjgF/YER057c/UK114 family)
MGEPLSVTRPVVTQNGLLVAEVPRTEFSEVYVTGLPATSEASAAREEAGRLYAAIAADLARRGSVVVQERVFGALSARDEILAAREEAAGSSDVFAGAPPVYLEGRPCDGDGLSGLHLTAIGPAEPSAALGPAGLPRGTRAAGRAFESMGVRYAYVSGMTGTSADSPLAEPEQARAMFARANAVLSQLGFTYPQVVRTWIYLGDILAWYDSFNAVRTSAYREFGVISDDGGRLPASTGIQARSPGAVACAMDLIAVAAAPGADLTVNQLHNPLQNEAYAYGSSFARAMEVVTQGARTVYVSGTASIDECGRTTHVDDVGGQIERTVLNVEALIGTVGLSLDDIVQATVFLKRAEDIESFRALCAGTVFDRLGVPVVADVCRPELLFEIDAIAAGPT